MSSKVFMRLKMFQLHKEEVCKTIPKRQKEEKKKDKYVFGIVNHWNLCISILKNDNPIDYETLMNIPTKGLPLDVNTENMRKNGRITNGTFAR